MLDFIKKYYRQRYVGAIKPAEKGQFLCLDKIRSVSFVYNFTSASGIQDLNEIASILDNTGISYRGLVIVRERGIKKSALDKDKITLLRSRNVSWTGVPKGRAFEQFCENISDLFICFNNDNNFTLNYICRINKSQFKVSLGHVSADDLFTMALQPPKNEKLRMPQMLERLLNYLKTINSESSDGK